MSIYVLARKISCNIMTYHDIYQHILACLVSEPPIVFTSFHVSNVPEWCTSIGRSPRWDRSNPWRWCPAEGRWKNRRDTGVMGGSCMPKTSKNQACSPQMFVFFSRDLKLYEIMLCKLVHCSPISAWEQDWSIQSTSGRVGLHFSKRWYIESVFRKKQRLRIPKSMPQLRRRSTIVITKWHSTALNRVCSW